MDVIYTEVRIVVKVFCLLMWWLVTDEVYLVSEMLTVLESVSSIGSAFEQEVASFSCIFLLADNSLEGVSLMLGLE